jgi:hypothetical protein
VALADTLWKGKRNTQLEVLFIKKLAELCSKDYWQLFIEMDSCFERIAAEGDARLLRSQDTNLQALLSQSPLSRLKFEQPSLQSPVRDVER